MSRYLWCFLASSNLQLLLLAPQSLRTEVIFQKDISGLWISSADAKLKLSNNYTFSLWTLGKKELVLMRSSQTLRAGRQMKTRVLYCATIPWWFLLALALRKRIRPFPHSCEQNTEIAWSYLVCYTANLRSGEFFFFFFVAPQKKIAWSQVSTQPFLVSSRNASCGEESCVTTLTD